MKISKSALNATKITLLCFLTYLSVYLAKNTLSAVSPQMLESGVVTQQMLGVFSSTYFTCYAVGQLINGMLGDKIKARYLICTGVVMAAVSLILFLNLLATPTLARIAYGLTGFFLSMIFAPLTKMVAENTDPIYTPPVPPVLFLCRLPGLSHGWPDGIPDALEHRIFCCDLRAVFDGHALLFPVPAL